MAWRHKQSFGIKKYDDDRSQMKKTSEKNFHYRKKTPVEMNIKLKKKITKETVISNAIKSLFT